MTDLKVSVQAVLRALAPSLQADVVDRWVDALDEPMAKAAIVTPNRIACFLGQAAHESAGFTRLEENLNYSAQRLCEVWPSRFPNLLSAAPFERNPKALANNVYGGRMGNEEPNDGYEFRGSGIFGLTGRSNATRFGQSVSMLPEQAAAWARTIPGAAASAAWFWTDNNLNRLADGWQITNMTRLINGPPCIGLSERLRLCNLAKKTLSQM